MSKTKVEEFKKFEITQTKPLLFVDILQGRRLTQKDAFAKVTFNTIETKTECAKKTDQPQWNQRFVFEVKDGEAETSSIFIYVLSKKTILGQVTLSVKNLMNEMMIHTWFPLENGTGDVLLKVLYSASDIGRQSLLKEKVSIDHFDDFEEAIAAIPPQHFAILFDHARCVPTGREIDAIVHTMIRVPEIKAKEIIQFVVETEVQQCETPTTLFRRNSLATKMMGAVLGVYGRKFLYKLLATYIQGINKDNHFLEVDPTKVTNPVEAEKAMSEVCKLTSDVIEMIIGNVEEIPIEIRQIATILNDECNKKYKNAQRMAIGGLIFLRFICPALTAPKLYNLVDQEIDSNCRRTLLLITKILQNLCNGVLFEKKEKFMIPANEILEKYTVPVEKMLARIPIDQEEFKVKRAKETGVVDFHKAIMVTKSEVQDLWALYVVHIYLYNYQAMIKGENDVTMFSLPIKDKRAFAESIDTIVKVAQSLGKPASFEVEDSKILKAVAPKKK